MAASIAASISESVSMSGAAFTSATVNVTGSQAIIVEDTIASGATYTVPSSAFSFSGCGLIYLLSDTNDVLVTFNNSGTAVTHTVTPGSPYLLFGTSSISAFLLRNVTSITAQNLNTQNGSGTYAVSTDIHFRIVLT